MLGVKGQLLFSLYMDRGFTRRGKTQASHPQLAVSLTSAMASYQSTSVDKKTLTARQTGEADLCDEARTAVHGHESSSTRRPELRFEMRRRLNAGSRYSEFGWPGCRFRFRGPTVQKLAKHFPQIRKLATFVVRESRGMKRFVCLTF